MSYSKIVLISGPSVAGKTTLSQYLLEHFAHEYEHVRQDDYLADPNTYPIDGSLLLTNEEIIAEADELIYLDVPLEVSLQRRAERAKRWNLDLGEYDREVLVPAYMKYQFLKSYADHVIDSTRPTPDIAKEVQQIIHKKSFLEGE